MSNTDIFPGTVLSVSEFNRAARRLIEAGFPLLWIGGEISNFSLAPSGHCYFSLKDSSAQVRCVMFRNRAGRMGWEPRNGLHVEVQGLPTLYEARGDFQVNVESMREAGVGVLFEAFLRLKARLEAEGLFDPARKRPCPFVPRRIGVVTSPAAAALRDVLATLRRRMPGIPVILYPTPVQGEGAGEKIAAALSEASRRRECDVLILCRGGGSLEDLSAFNEEGVARAIAASPIPVISGVGHQTDFTIADFVADACGATPTAAAELAAPHRDDLAKLLTRQAARFSRAMASLLDSLTQKTDFLGKRLAHPGERLAQQRERLSHLETRLSSAYRRGLEGRESQLREWLGRLRLVRPGISAATDRCEELRRRLSTAASRDLERRRAALAGWEGRLQQLNPAATLSRGYSIVRDRSGVIVRDSLSLAVGGEIRLTFAVGAAQATVTEVLAGEEGTGLAG